jgi:cell division protein FtsB
MKVKNLQEFHVLKEFLKKLIKKNEELKKENSALKRIIENFHSTSFKAK